MNVVNFSIILLSNILFITVARISGINGSVQIYLSYFLLALAVFQLLVVVFMYQPINDTPIEKRFNDLIKNVKSEYGHFVLISIRLISNIYCFKLTNNTTWLLLPIILYTIVPVINIKELYYKK